MMGHTLGRRSGPLMVGLAAVLATAWIWPLAADARAGRGGASRGGPGRSSSSRPGSARVRPVTPVRSTPAPRSEPVNPTTPLLLGGAAAAGAATAANARTAPQASPTTGPATLWISTTTTDSLRQSIAPDAWNAARFPASGSIVRVEYREEMTPMGMSGMIHPLPETERSLDNRTLRELGKILTNPASFSRELTPEDFCTTNSPSLEIRFRGDAGTLRVQLTPECNEANIMGFNLAEEPLGTLRIGYGPGRKELLEALREPAQGLVPDHQLR